uniref:RNA-directed DNA polymerase, eukaryota, reverse transcriptase zinc-binding domain protein n=1 Tax=Tanacetum cinerariifolium TaxID=118510 RepID=A0A699JS15_TANCI|nr:hypothetical protein [Tanacetum cinerariifolium]
MDASSFPQVNNGGSSNNWTIQDKILSAIKKSKNKYDVLKEEEINVYRELKQLKDRMIAEDRLKEKENLQEDTEDVMEGENIMKKKRSFRFFYYIMDKDKFLPIVEKEWKQEIVGHTMFKAVKKLKGIKYHMRNLNWKNGDLCKRVASCKERLKAIQRYMVKNPYNNSIKAKEAECLADYLKALIDEEKFFFQKTKVKWISNGDRNTKYFHKVIASKRNANSIMRVCNEKGE